jgi:carbon starvation protein
MNSLVIAVAAGLLFFLGYRFYGRIMEKLYGADPSRQTPAHEKYDGVDYVPAKHWTVLFGHHFSSIAGAAPVIGPIVALAYWGWLPAIAWVVLGTIFIGAVHDFGTLMVSVRHGGSSIAHVAESLISRRARILFSLFIWLTLMLIMAVFIYLCSGTLVEKGEIAIPSFGLIPVAILTGYLLYVRKTKQVPTTIAALALLVGLLVIGNYLPLNLGKWGLEIWMLVLAVYCVVASVTPVHILLQPRDYLSAFLLFIGLGIGYAGLVVTHPVLRLPAVLQWRSPGGPLWPLLFVTIACGAVSGFHSLIASGTTSKQLPSESHARRIGYGGMVAEGALAVLVLLAVASGFTKHSSLVEALQPGGKGPIAAFGQGYSFVTRPILAGSGALVAMTILNAFILTTLDTATRITRYMTQELFGVESRLRAAVPSVIIACSLAWTGRWKKIWPLFGGANQLMAALALMVITAWLLSHNKWIRYTLIPGIFMLATTVGSLVYGLVRYFKTDNLLLALISFVLLALSLLLLIQTLAAVRRAKRANRKSRAGQSPHA